MVKTNWKEKERGETERKQLSRGVGTRGLTPEKENNVKAQEFPRLSPRREGGQQRKIKALPVGARRGGLWNLYRVNDLPVIFLLHSLQGISLVCIGHLGLLIARDRRASSHSPQHTPKALTPVGCNALGSTGFRHGWA